jgi:glycosyltransferase involved in cell wall biosynthesis
VNKIIQISIIVPCYNQGKYLEECLQSVINQTYQNWECIIINDGSTDNTEEIALKWTILDNRFKYFYKTNGGLSSARNAGIKKSKGKFIQLLDSDDLLESKKLETQIDYLNIHEAIDLVYCSAKFFFNDDIEQNYLAREKINNDWTLDQIYPDFNFKRRLNNWNIMVVSAPLFKRTILKTVGFFDENLKSLEDWDFWIRICYMNFNIAYLEKLPDSLTLIRCYSGSMSTNSFVMLESELKVRFKHIKIGLKNKERLQMAQEKLISYMKKRANQSRKNLIFDIYKYCKFIDSKQFFLVIKFFIR